MLLHPSLALIGSLQFGISGPYDCHVYALRGPTGIVLIDSGGGTDTAAICRNLVQAFGSTSVDSLIITHAHLDHCGGAAEMRSLTKCRVICPAETREAVEQGDEEAIGLRAAREAGVYPATARFLACTVDSEIRDQREFEAGGLNFKAIRVRGHSRDSYCLVVAIEKTRWLFTGDAVFYGGILGVINSTDSHMGHYREDLPKLSGLALSGLFPGHGLFTFQGAERHLAVAREQANQGFLPRQIGQGDLIF